MKQLTAVILIYLTAITPLWSYGATSAASSGPVNRYFSGSPAHSTHAAARPVGNSNATALDSSRHGSPTLAALAAPEPMFFNGSGSGSGTPAGVTIFGPKQYLRISGPPNDYVDTVTVPAWTASPFDLHIQNGQANGCNRVSAAWININGVQVAGPSDFNQQVFVLDRSVNLTPTTTLEVKLASKGGGEDDDKDRHSDRDKDKDRDKHSGDSDGKDRHHDDKDHHDNDADHSNKDRDGHDDKDKGDDDHGSDCQPGSYLTITLYGTNTDHTPPQITLVSPVPGSTIGVQTPHLALQYADVVGSGEPAASGVNPSTLVVTLDGVDRTVLFTKTSSGASADLPQSLALSAGTHTLAASIQDFAGNTGHTSAQFTVSLQPPQVQVAQPTNGSYINTNVPTIRILYQGPNLDLSSLQVLINGEDRSNLFTKGTGEADATLTAGTALPNGSNKIVASLKNLGGSTGTDTSTFTVDTVAPVIVINQPANNSHSRGPSVNVSISYSDDQALDLTTFQATLDGSPLSLSTTATGATGATPSLADGSHTLNASIKDKAGNPATASVTFFIDNAVPNIHITAPPNGSFTNTTGTHVNVTYSDPDLDLSTFKVTLNGADITSSFTVSAGSASADLTGLAQGANTLAAQINDLAGNTGHDSSTFTVDTVAPVIAINQPANNSHSRGPSLNVSISYSDDQVLDLTTFQATLDGSPLSLSTTATGATGATPSLADGSHTLSASIKDKAGNPATAAITFFIDNATPDIHITAPLNGSFVATTSPHVNITFADPDLNLSTLKVASNGTDITGLFAVSPNSASADLTGSATLGQGTNTFTAQISDLAGNTGHDSSTFTVDTIPPQVTIVQPPDGSYTNQQTIVVSGTVIDASPVTVQVQGVSAAINGNQFTATVPLPTEGLQSLQAVATDAAGNVGQAAINIHVDRTPPVVVIAQPLDGSYTNQQAIVITGTVTDASPVTVQVQGVSATMNGNQFTATVPLPTEGLQSLQAVATDAAGNVGQASVNIHVDRTPPVVVITQPPDGSYTNQQTIVVSGTVTDASPVTVQVQGVSATINGNQFTATVPLPTEGLQNLQTVATDAAGNVGQAPVNVHVDRTPPVVVIAQPADGSYTNQQTIVVSGTVTDASPVTVQVQGVSATVNGTQFTASVPLPTEGLQNLQAVATDAAGNVGQASVNVHVDRTPPLVKILSPQAGAYIKGPVITVTGSVTDASSTMTDVNGISTMLNPDGTFSTQIPVVDGPLNIIATSSDAAGNVGTAQVPVIIDSVPPVITVTTPQDGLITNQATQTVQGTVTDAAPVTLTINGNPAPVTSGAFSQSVAMSSDGLNAFTLVATDAAGNSSTQTVHVTLDRTPPTLVIAAPSSGAVLGSLPVVVQGTVQDDTATTVTVDGATAVVTQNAWQLSVPFLPDGSHTFVVVATDAAGNSTNQAASVRIATQPPTVVITAPVSGSLTKNTSTAVSGTVASPVLSSVQVNGVAAAVQPSGDGVNATFSVASVPLNPGDNQLVATATDVLNRSGQATVLVTQDSIPPVIQLTTPTSISKLHPGQFTVAVTDNIAVAQFVVNVDGTPLGTFTSSPFQGTLSVPSGGVPGDTVTVAVTATDTAGNTATASRGVSVVADGVVVGQVLSDVTGLSLPGVNVSAIGSSQNSTTDDQGRYSLPANDAQIFLLVQADPNGPAGPMTTVERQVEIQSGVGTVPIDARLTPLASSSSIDAGGGTLVAGAISINVPAGAISSSTPFQLTALSSQGLPGLLPLGWSPLVSFDLRAGATITGPLNTTITKLPLQQTLHLVTYHSTVHSWIMVTPNLTSDSSGNLSLSLPGMGTYSLVEVDQMTPAMTIPDAGAVLNGTDMVLIPSTATTTSSVSPPSLPPSGGTAVGSLAMQSPTPLPSGTVVQAATTETFNLTSGQVASEEQRLQDVLLFRVPAPTGASLAAQFPITPSKKFDNGQLSHGDVHLDILAGRESVRGQVGGNDALTLSDSNITLTVGAGSLAQDTDMSIAAVALSSFDPTSNGLTPLAEVVVDLSGQILNTSAELTAAATGVSPADTLLIARVQRIDGVPYLTVVSVGTLQNGTIVSTAYPGLPGIKQEGRYVFYKLGSPVGFVAGVTSSTAGPVKAVVRTDSLPFISFSGLDGSYIVPALPGSSNLQAQVPDTSLQGSASTPVTAGQTANLNIALTGATTTATVTPADGATAVAVTTQIEITTSEPVKPASVTTDNIKLFQGAVANNQVVPAHFVLSVSGNSLAVIPQAALQFSTQYTLQASGLADVFGGSISVPTVTFTTASNTPPVYDTSKITFSFPDANGNVTVSAPAGTLAPGSTVLIIDATNGVVASFTVLNDGSLNGQFLATINDILQVTITDPHGNVTTFTSGQFVAPDGTVAVGPGGGTINGPNGTELIVPAGALNQGMTFKLDTFDSTLFPDGPDADNLQFGSGLKVHLGNAPASFNQPLSLVFPRPAGAPDNAQYYVYRRVVQPDGSIGYEVIDQAKLQTSGTSAPVVIASSRPSSFALQSSSPSSLAQALPPTPGVMTTPDCGPLPGYGLSNIADNYFIVMWFVDDILDSLFEFSQGAITGKVLSPSFQPGKVDPVLKGAQGTHVFTHKPSVVDEQTRKLVYATVQQDGTYALWDTSYKGGSVTVNADNIPGNFLPPGAPTSYQATAFEIPNHATIKNLVLAKYRNVATADITLPVLPQQPNPSTVKVAVVEEPDAGPNANTRSLPNPPGVMQSGDRLVIGVTQTAAGSPPLLPTDIEINVNGSSLDVKADATTDPIKFDVISIEIAGNPGFYNLVVKVKDPFGGSPQIINTGFKVIAAGGSVTGSVPGPPDILELQSYPKHFEENVPVTVNPFIVFSEPVIVPPGSVSLQDFSGANVPITVSGIDNNGNIVQDISTAAPDTLYTSITLQPLSQLRYSSQHQLGGPAHDPMGTYRIVFAPGTTGIHDTDDKDSNGNPIQNPLFWLPPYEFYTFEVDSFASQTFRSPGIFVARDRAYVAEVASTLTRGVMTMFDVSDPTQPRQITTSNGIIEGRADDVTGQDASPLVGGDTLVAVAEAPYALYGNGFQTSAVYLYRSNPATNTISWAGGVSLTSGATDGVVNSIAIKDTRLYAATMRKGIQVVDLQAALDEFSQQSGIIGNFKIQFLLGTEGQGFASDTVISTIPLIGVPEEEYKSWLFNVKADDFLLPGATQPQTLVVGTGYIPPPSSNPGLGISSFVVVDPNAGSLVTKLHLQTTNGSSLDFGRALALGTIPYHGGTHVAVVVGSGHAAGGACVSCSVMSVVDMTDPTNPLPLSIITVLSPNGGAPQATDVVLQNGRAIVALNDDTSLIYDLTDPTQPSFVELLSGVGGKLFSYNNSILFSSGIDPSNPTSALSGIHAAVLDILAVVPYVPPILSQDVDLSEKNSRHRKTLVPTPIYGKVLPNTMCTNNAKLVLNDGSGGIKAYPVNLMNSTTNGTDSIQIGRLTDFPNHSFSAHLEFQLGCSPAFASAAPIKSSERSIQLGTVKVTLDSDNNTKVEDVDDDVKRQSLSGTDAADPTQDPNLAQRAVPSQQFSNLKKFSFWESDARNDVITNVAFALNSGGISKDPDHIGRGLKGLADYATIRVTNDGTWDPGTVRLHLMGGPATTWLITEKIGQKKDYLSDETTSMKQLLSIAANTLSGGGANSTSVVCLFGFGSNQPDPAHYQGECTSDGTGSIQLPSLGTGEQREFLLRCANCPVNSDGTVPSRMIQVEYSDANVNQTPDVLDRVDADIRPFNQWVGAFSARDDNTGTQDDAETNMPKQTLVSVSGWGYTDQATGDNYGFPDKIINKYVTILVHGFNVSRDGDLNDFIPTYTKRLYWVGHPVLPTQIATMADGTKRPAYTLGIAWKGDHRDYLKDLSFITNLQKYLPDSWNDWINGKVIETVTNGLNGLYFPSDEFKALQSGVPVGNFFTQLHGNNNQTVVIAHSLGNMVVNSALRQSAPGMISKYIMNDGAVPAETFAANFDSLNDDSGPSLFDASMLATDPYVVPFLEPFRQTFLDAHLKQMGFSRNSSVIDQIWLKQLTQNVLTDAPGSCIPLLGCSPYGAYNAFYSTYSPLFDIDPLAQSVYPLSDIPYNDYTSRWTGQRSDAIVNNHPAPTSGPWQGYFAGNLAKTDIYNSFDKGDCVLAHPWFVKQLAQAPDGPFLSYSFPLFDHAFTEEYTNGINADPYPASMNPDNTSSGDQQLWLGGPGNRNVPVYPDSQLWSGNEGMGNHLQWSRLAFWFPARSLAIGDFGYSSIFRGVKGFADPTASRLDDNGLPFTIDLTEQNGKAIGAVDLKTPCADVQMYFTPIGPILPEVKFGQEFLSLLHTLAAKIDSHTYMTSKPLTTVWPAYKEFLHRLDPNQDPDQ